MPPSREDALRELYRRDKLQPNQRLAIEELSRRGQFDLETPQLAQPEKVIEPPEPLEPVLPSGVSEDDFGRIQRTGLTPGTAVQHAGVSIATENERRRSKGIDPLSAKQQEARLNLFQRSAGTPGTEIVDQFQSFQEKERTERSRTLGGRIRSAGLGLTSNLTTTGTSLIGLFAPETAANLQEELRVVLNPDGSRAGKAGAILGELAKVASFAKAGPAGLAAIFGAQGAGGVRVEVEELRREGRDISALQELKTAAAVGGVEAASGLVAGMIFGRLGKTFQKLNPILKTGMQQGKSAAIRAIVKVTLKGVRSGAPGMLAEGADEGLTQLITNKIRQGIKPEIAWTEGVIESALTGLLIAPFGAGGINLSQQGAASQQLGTQVDPQALLTLEDGTQAPTAKSAIQEAMAQEGEVVAQRERQTALATQEQQAGETEEQTLTRLLGTPAQQEQAQVEAEVQQKPKRGEKTDFQRLLKGQQKGRDGVVTTGAPPADASVATVINRGAGERSPEGTLSARKVDIDASREAMNNVLLDQKDVRTWEEAQVQAQEQDLPNKAMDLARGVIRKPKAFSDVETAGVVQRQMAMIQEHDALAVQMEKAQGEDIAFIAEDMLRLEQDHGILTEALDLSKSEKGRALNAQKLTINQDFKLISVLTRAKASKGKDLTPTERARVKKLSADIKRLETRLQNLRDRKVTPSTTLTQIRSKQIDKLEFQKSELQAKINRFVESRKPKTILGFTGELLQASKAIRSAFDVSAVGRQAGLAAIAHPIRAAKNMKPMFQALVSERAQFEINKKIREHPKFVEAKRAGLRITDTSAGAKLDQKEELYRSQLASRIPGVRPSDRAFSTFLNLMRMDGYTQLTDTLARNGQPTKEEAKFIADVVNNFTGFGGLGDAKASTKVLNNIFWSPSLQMARFQTIVARPAQIITGHRFDGTKLSPRVRLAVAAEYARILRGFAILAGMALLAGWEIETDPRSSNFMKFKQGNTRIDMGAGISQFIVLGSREAMGQTKSPVSGKVRDIRGDKVRFGQDDGADIFWRFARSKLHPGLGLGIDLGFSGKNVVGEKVNLTTIEGTARVVQNLVVPLIVEEIIESFKEQNVPTATMLTAMSIFGVTVQNFGDDKKRRVRR